MVALTEHLNKDMRADDLAILGNSQKYARWKETLKSRSLKVNIKKIKL